MTFTAPETKPLGDEILESPPAEPSPFSILSLPRPLPVKPNVQRRADGLPTGAFRLDHQRCLQAIKWPNCEPGDPDDYPTPAEDTGPAFYPVTWTVPVGCPDGAIPPDYERWAKEDVVAATAHQLESFLWSEASLESVQGPGTFMPSIMSVASVVGDPDEPVNPRDGLAALTADYKNCNQAAGLATVLIPDILGTYLFDRESVVANGTRLKTADGHNAVLGTGFDRTRGPFDNDDPSDPDDEGDGTAWIAAAGPIFYDLGTEYLPADPWGKLRSEARQRRLLTGSVDVRLGQQVVIAARSAQFAFDVCCVRAIKVRVPNVTAEVG